jgi:hypothetical protein
MATIKQVEDAIFKREGFRVKLTPLGLKAALPPYEHEYMCSNRWTVSEWQSVRLAPYVSLLRSAEVLRGDGKRSTTTMRLGNLRDTYFNAFCGDELAELDRADS